MSLTYQHSRFRYANQAVGAFVILTVIIFGAAFLFSGQVREWLEPGERIKVILPSDGLFGLSEGADVEVLGTRAGKVLRIVINPDRKMHADVQIQSDMKPFVRRDSSAVIRKRFGVAGDSFLDISRGFGQSHRLNLWSEMSKVPIQLLFSGSNLWPPSPVGNWNCFQIPSQSVIIPSESAFRSLHVCVRRPVNRTSPPCCLSIFRTGNVLNLNLSKCMSGVSGTRVLFMKNA